MTKFLKENRILLVVLILFIFLRLLVIGQIYHQDEHRWLIQANSQFNELSPHPPLGKYFFRLIGLIFGFDFMRIAPFVFSLGVVVLVYFVSMEITKSKMIALWALGLYAINIYAIIASVQIDLDGAIVPFFGLLFYYSYLKILEGKKKWIYVLILSLIGGFLAKLSFMLFVSAGFIDYLFVKRKVQLRNIPRLLRGMKLWIVLGGALVFLIFYQSKLPGVIDYAKHFNTFNFGSRAYFDLAFKLMKSLVWISPLLFFPFLFGFLRENIFKKYFFWLLYLVFNTLLYLIIFDFSTLTIERYLMFLIVPVVLISAEIIHNLMAGIKLNKNKVLLAILIFLGFSSIIFLPQKVLPLNPKEAYLESIKNLDFNFLIPFTGGSGPVGFYFSAQYILFAWILTSVFISAAILSKKNRFAWVALFLVFGLGYNFLFIAEYARGYFYGSPDKLAKESIEYVLADRNIKRVITYYDFGAYELKVSGKYLARFYTAPKRDYSERLGRFNGHYMIVDFPSIDKNGRYWPLITQCQKTKEFKDKYIQSFVFDCSNKLI